MPVFICFRLSNFGSLVLSFFGYNQPSIFFRSRVFAIINLQHVLVFEIGIFEHFWTWMFWEHQFLTVLEFDLVRTSCFLVIRF